MRWGLDLLLSLAGLLLGIITVLGWITGWEGMVVGLLVVVAALAPTLVSTTAAKDFAVAQVNDRILGNVAIGGVSLGWFTPTEASAIAVLYSLFQFQQGRHEGFRDIPPAELAEMSLFIG